MDDSSSNEQIHAVNDINNIEASLAENTSLFQHQIPERLADQKKMEYYAFTLWKSEYNLCAIRSDLLGMSASQFFRKAVVEYIDNDKHEIKSKKWNEGLNQYCTIYMSVVEISLCKQLAAKYHVTINEIIRSAIHKYYNKDIEATDT
jgi:hypothetical protein